MSSRNYQELRCPSCGWSEVCGREATVRWLAAAQKIRLGREPDEAILDELFRVTAGQFTCPACGKRGLVVSAAKEDEFDWPDVVPCAACSKPIPSERLEALPGVTLCAACQRAEESGEPRVEVEYCPRCGAAMVLRPSRGGGITRYVFVCTATPPCRR
jgi:predicted RNA-binding Zn-ribbon protein involved in translation (DUF1610 family)